MEIEVRIEYVEMGWAISKKFQLAAVPSIGTMITTTAAGNWVEVDSVYLNLDTNVPTLFAKGDGNVIRSFYHEGGWQVVDDPHGVAERELADPQ